jgi:hypothetical protein
MIDRPPDAKAASINVQVSPANQPLGDSGAAFALPGITIPDGMGYISQTILDPLPWLTPSVVAFLGGPGQPGDGGLQVVTMYEWPVPYLNASDLQKTALETLHVSRLQTDALLALRELPFTVVGRGAEPPDFLIKLGDNHLGLECTVLADSRRRTVEGLFSRIRQRILKEPRGNLSHLAGYNVIAWFVREDSLAADQLPHRVSDTEAIDALVSGLRRLRPGRPGEPVGPPSDYTQKLSQMGVVSSGYGCLFYAVPMQAAVRNVLLCSHGIRVGVPVRIDSYCHQSHRRA